MSRQQVRQLIADSEGVSYEERIAKRGLTPEEVLDLIDYKEVCFLRTILCLIFIFAESPKDNKLAECQCVAIFAENHITN